jgi:hypothetical protein
MAKCSRAGVEVYQYLGFKMPFHPNWIKVGGYFWRVHFSYSKRPARQVKTTNG